MSSICDTLRCFHEYLTGDNARLLSSRMEFYKRKLVMLNRDFHTVTIADEEIWPYIEPILEGLGVSKTKRGRYLNASLTVYEFLVEVRDLLNGKNEKLNEFIRLIEEKDKTQKRIIKAATFLSVTAVSALAIFLASGGLTVIQALLAETLFFPVVGLIYTVGVGLYSAYQNIFDKKKSFRNRFLDNFFLFANTALNMAAYGILIVSATMMNPVAAILFVVASVVNSIKELVSLIQISIEMKRLGPVTEQDSLEERQRKTRIAHERAKVRNAVAIELATSVAIVGIIAAWSFVPGGILVSLVALLAIAVVYGVKKWVSSYNDKVMKSRLNRQFETLEREEEAKESVLQVEPEPASERVVQKTGNVDVLSVRDSGPDVEVQRGSLVSRIGFFGDTGCGDGNSRAVELSDDDVLTNNGLS